MVLFDFSKEIREINQILSTRDSCIILVQTKKNTLQNLKKEKKLLQYLEKLSLQDIENAQNNRYDLSMLDVQLNVLNNKLLTQKAKLKSLYNTFTIDENDEDPNLPQYPSYHEQFFLIEERKSLINHIENYKKIQQKVFFLKRTKVNALKIIKIQSFFQCDLEDILKNGIPDYIADKRRSVLVRTYGTEQSLVTITNRLTHLQTELQDKIPKLLLKYRIAIKQLKYFIGIGFALACILNIYFNSIPLLIIGSACLAYGIHKRVSFFKAVEQLSRYSDQAPENIDSANLHAVLQRL